MTDATTPSASPHASHDTMLIAALAARAQDLPESDLELARELTTTCTGCAEVLADLLMLQTVLPTTSTPARPRDFRLTVEDAARLHRTGWRRVLGFFGSARDSVSRPLAVGMTTLGLAGLLVATFPTMFAAGMLAAPPAGQAMGEGAAPAVEPYASAAAASAAASGAPEEEVFSGGDPRQLEAQRGDIAGAEDLAIRDDTTGLSTLFVVAGVLLIAGLGLFGLRWSARRLH